MVWMLKSTVKFAFVKLVMTMVCTIIWQEAVNNYLYDCADGNLLDFLSPGNWVHFYHGVVYVPHVTHDHSMSDPDSIKQGWNVTRLWYLWFSFFTLSLFISVLLARRKWIPARMRQTNQ